MRLAELTKIVAALTLVVGLLTGCSQRDCGAFEL